MLKISRMSLKLLLFLSLIGLYQCESPDSDVIDVNGRRVKISISPPNYELPSLTLFRRELERKKNAYNSSLSTTVHLTVTNRMVQCSIHNLPPNNNYVVNYYRDSIRFAFYRVRTPEVIFSSTNLDRFADFYPSQGHGVYPNFTLSLSSDSDRYGIYQCTVETLTDNRKSYSSNQVHVLRDRTMARIRWNRTFPTATVNYTVEAIDDYEHDKIYEAKCRVNFDRTVEEYDVCFIESTYGTIGCYEVRKDNGTQWRNELMKRHETKYLNEVVLENEEESVYPEFVTLMKGIQEGRSTHCEVVVPSDKHPIYFSSASIVHPPPPINKPTPEPGRKEDEDYEEICDLVDDV